MSELRISGGSFRGRKIEVPQEARPTEGRVREALFSVWSSRIDGAHLLDLFAGSGAIGFEALSRGAAGVVLVDSSRRVVETLAKSREKLGIDKEAARILTASLPTGKLGLRETFDLIFADPPYAFEDHEALLLSAEALLAPDGELALEHSAKTIIPKTAGNLRFSRQKSYGSTALTYYRCAFRREAE